MGLRHTSFSAAVATVVACLEAAFHAHARAIAAQSQGRRGNVWERDLSLLLDEIIPDTLFAEDGRDGRVMWMIAVAAFTARRGAVEAALVQRPQDRPGTADRDVIWRRFMARLLLSPAALDWGDLERRCRAVRSSRLC